jgi:putative transposase
MMIHRASFLGISKSSEQCNALLALPCRPARAVKTLMRRMGIEALYRPPRTTKPEPGHKIESYAIVN